MLPDSDALYFDKSHTQVRIESAGFSSSVRAASTEIYIYMFFLLIYVMLWCDLSTRIYQPVPSVNRGTVGDVHYLCLPGTLDRVTAVDQSKDEPRLGKGARGTNE